MAPEVLIAKFEGCELTAYPDVKGVWTVGYGSTINLDTNQPIKKGDKIDQQTALEWLKKDTLKFSQGVSKLIKVPITENQLTALTSFAYNVGLGAFSKSTLLKLLNAKAPKDQVSQEFLKWCKANGRIVKGLLNRRKAEAALFNS
jgi:lysozyme